MWWVIALSLLVGIGRFFVPGHGLSWPGTYEAMAHIWVGALFVWALSDGSSPQKGPRVDFRISAIACLVVITVLEIVMFLLR